MSRYQCRTCWCCTVCHSPAWAAEQRPTPCMQVGDKQGWWAGRGERRTGVAWLLVPELARVRPTSSLTHPVCAAAAAAPLLALAAALEASLGPVAAARLPVLSRAFSRWDLDLAAFTAVPRPPRQWLAHLLELAPLCV